MIDLKAKNDWMTKDKWVLECQRMSKWVLQYVNLMWMWIIEYQWK